jgi:hypothetical protein
MAGLKKPTKRRDSGNPNTVLVIFLVFFILLSIGLGVWGYYGYAGQEKLRQTAKDEKATTASARVGLEYATFNAQDKCLAIGIPLSPEEMASWASNLESGKFKDEKSPPWASIEKMIEDNKAILKFDAAGKKYSSSYRDILTKLAADLKKAQGDFLAADANHKAAEEKLRKLQTKYDDQWKKALASIKEGNDELYKVAVQKTAEMQIQFNLNQDLQNKLQKANEQHKEEADKYLQKITLLEAELKKNQAPPKQALAENTITRSSEPHALLLDISKGRTMWDDPLGKISRVDLKERQVYINVGSGIGIKPQMTFNVFGASWKNRAEGPFKGTIEVVRVLGSASSIARITSLYDITGLEIPLNDLNKGRIQREADNPLKEGDLLFNLAFGARVVLAGNINWTGYSSDSPAEQMRNLEDFMRILGRQGVGVDAYLDLADGKVKGEITSRTRFLIRGDLVAVPKDAKLAESAKLINDAIGAIRRDAIERGMFIISADNFANVIGYRRPRSANDLEESSGFRPALPSAPSVPQ